MSDMSDMLFPPRAEKWQCRNRGGSGDHVCDVQDMQVARHDRPRRALTPATEPDPSDSRSKAGLGGGGLRLAGTKGRSLIGR